MKRRFFDRKRLNILHHTMDPSHNAKSRQAMAFRMPESNENSPKAEPMEEDDSFYELTLEEVRGLYNEILKQKEINDKLLPRSKREEEEKKLRPPPPSYVQTIIRVEFPDRTILQGEFKSDETISDVKEFVREHVKEPGTSFELFTSPPKAILPDGSKLMDLRLVPAAKLYVGIQSGTDFQFLPGQTSVVPYEFAQSAANGVRKPPEKRGSSPGPSPARATNSQPTPSNSNQETTKKVPKWFKMKK